LAELPGIWTSTDGRPPHAALGPAGVPFYLTGWNAFQKHPELYDDIAPAPYFVLDLVSAFSPVLRDALECTSKTEYTAIYIGPEGSLSSLFADG